MIKETLLKILRCRQVRILLILLFAAVCGAYLYHDFRLDLTAKFEKLPDVSIFNVKLNKEINGRQWQFVSPKVETKDNILYADELKVRITEKSGAVNNISAKKGSFSKEKDFVKLSEASGRLISKGKALELNSGTAEYDVKNDAWKFGGELCLSDGRMTVTADSGSFDNKSGMCRVKGKGKVAWEE